MPISISNSISSSPARFNGKPSVIVAHREYVTSLVVPAGPDFQLLGVSSQEPGYDINPSSPFLFPWCSNIAAQFEKFRFTKLEFHLVPSSPTTTPGKWVLFVDYDYDDPVPTSKIEMLNSQPSKTFSAFQESSLKVNIAQMNRGMEWRYTMAGSRTVGAEPRTTYGGYLVIASDGIPAGTQCDLIVQYVVELQIPQVNVPHFTDLRNTTGNSLAGANGYVNLVTPTRISGPPLTNQWGVTGSTLDLRKIGAQILETAIVMRDGDITGPDGSTIISINKPVITGECYDVEGTWKGRIPDIDDTYECGYEAARDYSQPLLPVKLRTKVANLLAKGIRYVIPQLYLAAELSSTFDTIHPSYSAWTGKFEL